MFGRGLMVKAAAIAAVGACVFVAVVALGFAVYAGLDVFLVPAGAAAVTALLFAIAAGVTALVVLGPKDPEYDEDEPVGVQERVVGLFRTRPILGTVAGLAAGYIVRRNPALASMVAAAFTEKARGPGSRR